MFCHVSAVEQKDNDLWRAKDIRNGLILILIRNKILSCAFPNQFISYIDEDDLFAKYLSRDSETTKI